MAMQSIIINKIVGYIGNVIINNSMIFVITFDIRRVHGNVINNFMIFVLDTALTCSPHSGWQLEFHCRRGVCSCSSPRMPGSCQRRVSTRA